VSVLSLFNSFNTCTFW